MIQPERTDVGANIGLAGAWFHDDIISQLNNAGLRVDSESFDGVTGLVFAAR